MSIFDFLKSAPKVVDNVFDKDKGLLTQVGQWVGHQQYTEEEKALHDADMGKNVRAFAIATMDGSTERSKARRELAIAWINMQIWLIKLQVLFFAIDKFNAAIGAQNLNLSRDFSEIAFSQLIWAVTSGIALFFWGSHTLRSSKFSR